MKRLLIMLCLSMTVMVNFSCKNDKNDDADDMEDDMERVENEDRYGNDEDEDENMAAGDQKKVTVALQSKSNSNATGNVVFTEENGVVKMVAVMSGLESGSHAIHLHETADCSAADATSSGGHWNPTGQPHGKWGDIKGYHKGDIGNFNANENGNATTRFETNKWCIGCGDDTRDILGKAVVVHKGQDDFVSQPSGAAGDRISCGGVIQ